MLRSAGACPDFGAASASVADAAHCGALARCGRLLIPLSPPPPFPDYSLFNGIIPVPTVRAVRADFNLELKIDAAVLSRSSTAHGRDLTRLVVAQLLRFV